MRHPHIIGLFLLAATTANNINAQVNSKNAHKAVLNIFTYDQNHNLLKSGNAFYIDNASNAITSFDILKGAFSAELIDYQGKVVHVHRILGANSTTNLVKFSTDAPKTNLYFKISDSPLDLNSQNQLIQYSKKGSNKRDFVNITKVEAFNDYKYYHTSASNNPAYVNCPLIDDNGLLVAVMQYNFNKDLQTACAIDARFIKHITINETSSLDSDLKTINIPKGIPDRFDEAQTYIYMYPMSDTLNYHIALNDFVAKFPNAADGYINKANYYASRNMFKECEQNFELAIDKAQNDTLGMSIDYVHYCIGDLINRTLETQKDTTSNYTNWNYSRVIQEFQKAYSLNKNTVYLLSLAKVYYTQELYEKAYEAMKEVCKDQIFANAENFFFMAILSEKLNQDISKSIAWMNKCIDSLPHPVSTKDAAYYLERAQRFIISKRYREAVLDYIEYEKILTPHNLDAEFYYIRQDIEMNARMYQQALDDIRTAIVKSNNSIKYRIEEAYILMRVGEFKDAILVAETILKEDNENLNCLKILGISYKALGKQEQALKYLNKAKALGDLSVESILKQDFSK